VPEAPQASKGHIEDSLPNSGIGVSFVILLAQIINVKSTILPTQTPNASLIEIKITRQKELDDVVDTTPPRKNIVGHPQ
jgi:DNA topoisomerase VI subunit B